MTARCSDTARERQDPLVGTAAPARRWLLLEHPGPWAIDALAGSRIGAPVQARLRAAALAASARILLVRRPGRTVRSGRPLSWFVLDHTPDVADVRGSWQVDEDLLDAADALAAPSAPAAVQVLREPMLLVCAHGRHDTCCAVRGRPVAAALQRFWPEATWECSHVGGDRFAANLVVLPDGTTYGNLDPESAVDVVRAHLAGRVSVPYLRGFSTQLPVVQAAAAAVHERWGPAGPYDVRDGTLQTLDDGSWRVTLAGTGPLPSRAVAVLRRTVRPAAHLTCRAQGSSVSAVFEVVDLREA